MRAEKLTIYGITVISLIAAGKTLIIMAVFGAQLAAFEISVISVFVAVWLATAVTPVIIYQAVTQITARRGPASVMLSSVQSASIESVIDAHGPYWRLTKAEADVAIMLVKGFSNAEIASMRKTAVQTVKTQASAIYLKSGLPGRYQLMAFVADAVQDLSLADAASGQPNDQRHVASFG